ncbi:phosphate/phosphite/phosphonate ABC transporter substrate-binding protein [Effusibacillus lacus]|uniref:Phosphonate ABC transporter substrate-binding protein n=1 Tax=Effusibacillus lacus TaxID=1348429 RepID=A0A292YLZ1_9BACL|nr:phosphate/phosphite/phosphonate ABC transporter substrate-binding protein [Effusibacillus lacus]TCS71389.1 phosphonate transport system substrate-binding protein [Effusibacillus lacus]GAX89919.1 phosphonate ABC transporter substrate-binding protein [Effusibacillus lacus]
MKRSRILVLVVTLIMSLVVAACGSASKPQDNKNGTATPPAAENKKEFLVGIIPAEAKFSGSSKEKLQQYLSEKIGQNVVVKDYPDYNGVVEALNAGKIQLAYLGPLTYVIAHHQSGAKPVVVRTTNGGKPFYYSYIITPADSKLNTLDDLVKNSKELKFAFGDINSTSGSLVPGAELRRQGVFTDRNTHKFKELAYTGSHDITAKSIQAKKYDAGAIDSAYFDKLIAKGEIKKEDYKIIWKSEELFQYPFAVNKDVSDDTVKKLQDAFVALKDKEILDAFAADGFVVTKNEDFEAIRKVAESEGRLKK